MRSRVEQALPVAVAAALAAVPVCASTILVIDHVSLGRASRVIGEGLTEDELSREAALLALAPEGWDLEARFGLTEGSISHGELTLDQFFFARPIAGWARYRTPVEGLYLCGAGTHGGGGVNGIPGRNAASAVLNDRKRWLR